MKTDDMFDELFEEADPEEEAEAKGTRILTNENVLFTVSYLSSGDEVCTEGFVTKRFAAEIAKTEACKTTPGTWIDIIETGNGLTKDTLVGTFKVTEDLVSMKITEISRIKEHADSLDIDFESAISED